MKRIGLILIAILLVAFPLFSQNVNIPDTNFSNALIDEGVDTNNIALEFLNCRRNQLTSLDVQNNITLSLPAKSGRYYANILQTQKL